MCASLSASAGTLPPDRTQQVLDLLKVVVIGDEVDQDTQDNRQHVGGGAFDAFAVRRFTLQALGAFLHQAGHDAHPPDEQQQVHRAEQDDGALPRLYSPER